MVLSEIFVTRGCGRNSAVAVCHGGQNGGAVMYSHIPRQWTPPNAAVQLLHNMSCLAPIHYQSALLLTAILILKAVQQKWLLLISLCLVF